ncbi:teichoic acid transporter [Tenuifilaceae bacterium CYCD]|nr:teichoic acid transporter [Tenuifilaceae bacterium CYCD]
MPNIKEKIIRHKTLFQNLTYLSVLQLFNVLLPIFTYPYLIRTLGKEIYGLVIYAQAVVSYLVLMVGFGFNISATKEISIHRDNKLKLSEIVSSVLIIKGVLFLVAMIIITLIVIIAPDIKQHGLLFYLTMWLCIYEFIFPVFYFQGIEKMKYITYLTLVSRLLFLTLIFVFVHSKQDYLKVPILSGVGAIIAGLLSQYILYKDGIYIKLQSISTLKYYIKNSYVMALAYASNAFKYNFNLILVKLFFSYSEVAYFDLALKISNIGNTFLDLISQSIFPKMSREKDSKFLVKVIKISLLISFVFILFIQFFSNQIVILLGGADMLSAVNILRVIVFFIPIYILGALLGRNCLIVHGFDKNVLLSMFYSSLLYVLILSFFYYFKINISLVTLTIIFIFSYIFESLYRFYLCKKFKIL